MQEGLIVLTVSLNFHSKSLIQFLETSFRTNGVFQTLNLNFFFQMRSFHRSERTSLLHRLKTQTLPNGIPPIGKLHPFSKIAVTVEPMMQFGYPLRSILYLKAPS